MSWYTTGTVSLTNGSKTVTGVGTKWTNPLIGVCAGQMLILKTANTIEICEIASVQSDTQLTLASQYSGASKKGVSYEVPTAPNVSIEALALRISEMLNYYQQQMNSWQSILTETGDITLTAPDGKVVTIKSQKALTEAINNAVKKSGDTINGQLIIDSDWSGLKIKNSQGNLWITRVHPDNSYSISSFDTSTNTNQFKLRYVGSLNKWRFENIEDVTISGKSVLKAGDGGLFSQAPSLPSGTNLLSDDVLSVSQTFTLAGNYSNAPITGITGTLIVTRRMYDAGACATLEINQTNNKYYKTTARKASNGWVSDGWVEQITTANSTVDSNGFYKKASPILRLYGTENIEKVDGFKKSGCALVNDLAAGVTAKRIDVGHYKIHGSLGFAKEGWYIQLPEDANGNKKFFADYSADENGIITIKTFTKKFDFERCEVVAGEPVDITDGRWIDVRLEMPVVEVIENEDLIPSTLNPVIVSEVSDDI